MARSDLLVNLVRAGLSSDQKLMKKTVEALVSEERSKQHNILANKLEEVVRHYDINTATASVRSIDEKTQSLFYEVNPQRRLEELILPKHVFQACSEIIEEHHRSDLLRSYNLEPRNRILLSGPPGNGKTTLAEAMAEALFIPLIVVRYDSIIGSYLGETAQRLKRLFDYVKTRRCLLFFDEFDSIGKERGDNHETGEIKRVVSSLLLQIDDLPSYVVIVTATNHSELLDRAVWRRFQVRLELPLPTKEQIEEWFLRFQKSVSEPIGIGSHEFVEKLAGLSFAELQDFCTDVIRRFVLSVPSANIDKIIRERLEQWKWRCSVPVRKRRED